MLYEALKYVVGLGQKAENPAILRTEAEPPHVYYLKTGDALTRTEAVPPPPAHKALSLDAIAELATDAAKESAGASLWYSPAAVVLLTDATRRGRVTLDLATSEPLALLAHWKATKPALAQADLIRALRITLGDCLAPAGEILAVLKRVKFNAGVSTDTEIAAGKTSLGKQITNEVTGVGVLPETLTFSVPVFGNACLRSVRTNVKCALDPDAATATFRVIPLPGQIEAAIEYGTEQVGNDLRARLDGVAIGIHHGSP